MYYETRIKYTSNGEKTERKTLLINAENFSSAEVIAYKSGEYDNIQDQDVNFIKRSDIIEVISKKQEEEERYYKATVADVFVNEDGKEKLNKYRLLVSAESQETATTKTLHHLTQGLSDFRIIKIEETNITEIIE